MLVPYQSFKVISVACFLISSCELTFPGGLHQIQVKMTAQAPVSIHKVYLCRHRYTHYGIRQSWDSLFLMMEISVLVKCHLGLIQYKMLSYQYRNSHCGDKTILLPSYVHNGISYTGKTNFYIKFGLSLLKWASVVLCTERMKNHPWTANRFYASAFRRRRHYVFGLSVRPSEAWNTLFWPVHGSVGPPDQPWPFYGMSVCPSVPTNSLKRDSPSIAWKILWRNALGSIVGLQRNIRDWRCKISTDAGSTNRVHNWHWSSTHTFYQVAEAAGVGRPE